MKLNECKVGTNNSKKVGANSEGDRPMDAASVLRIASILHFECLAEKHIYFSLIIKWKFITFKVFCLRYNKKSGSYPLCAPQAYGL